MLLPMLVFSIIMAFCIAKLEINVEGKDGFAKKLPTYRFSNWFTKLIMGRTKMTGYHVWLNITVFAFLQFPFFIGYPWSLDFEMQIIAVLLIGIMFEDFFWFVLNPAFGWRKFEKKDAPWHKWIGPVPALYLIYAAASSTFLLLS